MRRVAGLLVIAAALVSACGSQEPVPLSDIDRQSWTQDLIETGGVSSHPDLERLYDLTVDDCKAEVDDLALRFTVSGARPDWVRVNMQYVCPSKVSRVDEALESVNDATSEVDEACDTPAEMRTEEQRDLAEAMNC